MHRAVKKQFKEHIFVALIGGLILSIWGAFSWHALPWHQNSVKRFTNEQRVLDVLESNAPESGLYLAPFCKADRANGQPLMFGMVHPHMHKRSAAASQLIHFIMNVIAVYILAWMFVHIKKLSYWRKVGFVTLAGFFAAAVMVLPHWNFLQYPFSFALVMILDITIGWFLAGLAIAKIHTMRE